MFDGKEKRTFLEIKKRHAEDGREIRAGQKERPHERDGLHGGAVAFAGVGDAALLSGDFEIQPRFALRHDVVQLGPLGQCLVPGIESLGLGGPVPVDALV